LLETRRLHESAELTQRCAASDDGAHEQARYELADHVRYELTHHVLPGRELCKQAASRRRSGLADHALVVAVEEATGASQDGSFLTSAAPKAWHGLNNAIRHSTQGQGLQPYSSRTTQRRKEQAFASEDRGLDLPDVLDVVAHRWLKRHDATGINADQFPR